MLFAIELTLKCFLWNNFKQASFDVRKRNLAFSFKVYISVERSHAVKINGPTKLKNKNALLQSAAKQRIPNITNEITFSTGIGTNFFTY